LLLVAFLLVNALNCHLSLVLASVVQGDAVNCNTDHSTVFTLLLELNIIFEQRWMQFELQNSPSRVFAFDRKIYTTI